MVSFLAMFAAGCAGPGSAQKQLGPSTYVLDAIVNIHNPTAALKPTILARAQSIAREGGYTDFLIEKFEIREERSVNGWRASAIVNFSRAKRLPVPGVLYLTAPEERPVYKSTLDPVEAAGLAKLNSFRKEYESGIILRTLPAFLDALSAGKNQWDGSEMSFLRPGSQEFHVLANVGRTLALTLQRTYSATLPPHTETSKSREKIPAPQTQLILVSAQLMPGRSYSIAAEIKNEQLTYWVEDDETKQPVSATRSTPIEYQ